VAWLRSIKVLSADATTGNDWGEIESNDGGRERSPISTRIADEELTKQKT
jgi:hypothetical protein